MRLIGPNMHPPYPSFAAIELAGSKLKEKLKLEGIDLREFIYITTSEEWDKQLGLLVVYETKAELIRRTKDGTNELIKDRFLKELSVVFSIFPYKELPQAISCEYESYENIKENYQGSYYLRLR